MMEWNGNMERKGKMGGRNELIRAGGKYNGKSVKK